MEIDFLFWDCNEQSASLQLICPLTSIVSTDPEFTFARHDFQEAVSEAVHLDDSVPAEESESGENNNGVRFSTASSVLAAVETPESHLFEVQF